MAGISHVLNLKFSNLLNTRLSLHISANIPYPSQALTKPSFPFSYSAMQTQFPHSQLVPFGSLSVTSTDSQSQKAWYLLSLLLSLGHPTLPLDLASRCTLFRATPDLIISLCSIPNSPITLITSSSGIHVTISLIGLFAFQRFVSNVNLIDAFLTPIRTQVRGTGMLKDVVRVYFRKRKRIGFDSGEGKKWFPILIFVFEILFTKSNIFCCLCCSG